MAVETDNGFLGELGIASIDQSGEEPDTDTDDFDEDDFDDDFDDDFEEEIEDDEFGSDFGDSESNDGRLGNDSSGH